MIQSPFHATWQHLRYLPLWSALTVNRFRAFDRRSRALGTAVGLVLRWFPVARRRCDREILRVFPAMPRPDRMRLIRAVGQNMGRTLFEIYHAPAFQARPARFSVAGPGLDALTAARAAGRGAIIVSGHFGQWDAVRAVLKARGMETGAVYRPQTNRHYQRRLLAGIKAGGQPILPTGARGTGQMVRHLKQGGFVAILLDEKYPEGERLDFLGLPALTSLAAARMALRYDVPLVPAYGTRTGDGSTFAVEFEAPIPPSDPRTMTQAANDSLAARVRARPEQWYWLLRRWQGA
ncbi:MAG: lysophospholipid acyltransferase family protein [Rhodobacterales bacterium]|nr:lysophospholipid acyltransferase family protein [Rhodobacterales bacterium]NCT11879.1 lysophospholipid acyltransferase family protein [Rhodobacterales bacterium]